MEWLIGCMVEWWGIGVLKYGGIGVLRIATQYAIGSCHTHCCWYPRFLF